MTPEQAAKIDVFTFTDGDGRTGFVAGEVLLAEQSDMATDRSVLRDLTRCAVFFDDSSAFGEAWVLSCEETRQTEDEAVRWVAAVRR